ncbi:MAG TPA: zinc ABC transporter substrate-binding protein [Acholeplasma sp.]|nr:zinc ABC transporter substrate-binding protein [Acholeplasma sp.]
MKKILLMVTLLLAVLTLTACGNQYTYEKGKVNIVATTTMLGDLSKQLGGDKVAVKTLMGVGVDPHLYSAKASDTNALDKSDFIVFGGLHLEGKMVDILESLSTEKPYLNSGESLLEAGGSLLFDEKGNTDPHVWFNVENWIIIAKSLTAKLIDYDQDNKAYYETRGQAYVSKLEDLHDWINTRVAELTEAQRVLVTAHDAFRYFADAYGFEVEAIQGISTDSEASISDINRLVDLVVSKKVKAIFIESSVPQKTINSVIASAKNRGYTLSIGGELYSDSLGDGEDSDYINAVKTNVNQIVDALK